MLDVRQNVGEVLRQIGNILESFLENLKKEKNMEPKILLGLLSYHWNWGHL